MPSCQQPRPPASPFSSRGFTLVELLTVLAIVGVLAAILVPVVGSARDAARESLSVSNLRQIGVAILGYAGDHQGRLPRSSHGYGQEQNSWINTLRPYLGENDAVRACPLDPRADKIIEEKLSSFTLNEWLLPPTSLFSAPESRFTRLNRLSQPNRTFLAFVNREEKAQPDITDDHTHSTSWTSWSRVIADIDPDRFRRGATRKPDHTGGSSPYLFADAHVAVITAPDLVTQLAAAVTAGRALSQPAP